MGANPVQIEVGEFDEAIDIGEEVEEVAAESKFTNTHRHKCTHCIDLHHFPGGFPIIKLHS